MFFEPYSTTLFQTTFATLQLGTWNQKHGQLAFGICQPGSSLGVLFQNFGSDASNNQAPEVLEIHYMLSQAKSTKSSQGFHPPPKGSLSRVDDDGDLFFPFGGDMWYVLVPYIEGTQKQPVYIYRKMTWPPPSPTHKPQFLVQKRHCWGSKFWIPPSTFRDKAYKKKTGGPGRSLGPPLKMGTNWTGKTLVAGANQNKDKHILSGKINTRSFYRFGKSVYESRPYVHPFENEWNSECFSPF